MFYPIELPKPDPAKKQDAVLVVLSSAQSRRLVARATVACDAVKKAYREGMIIIARGITNAYVCEEFFGTVIANKSSQTVGFVGAGVTDATSAPPPFTGHIIEKGKLLEGADSNQEILKFKKGDILIKGANAVDHTGLTGTYAASLKGGTMGMSWPVVTPRGAEFIIPVSLEKLVPSVADAARHTSVNHFSRSSGMPVKLIPLLEGLAITEIQAFAILCGVKAYHIGSGGIAGSEGSVHLSLEGDADKVESAFELFKSLRKEPPLALPGTCRIGDPEKFSYDAFAQLETLGGM